MSIDGLSAEAERLTSCAVRDHRTVDDHTGWISFDLQDHTAPHQGIVVRSEPGLYAGRLGVAVFLAAGAAVGSVSAGGRLDRLIDDVGTFGDRTPERVAAKLDLGIGGGLGSLFYGLSVLAELTGDDQFHERARSLAGHLSDDRLANADSYDVLGGLAGTVQGLCRLYERTGDETALARAVTAGETLVESRIPKWGVEVWDTSLTSQPSCSTGMAHGAGGICHALYRLYGHTGRTAFREAADSTLRYENAFYSPIENNWRNNWQSVPEFSKWWCYGAPGIGLARIGSLASHDSETLQRDLDRAAGFEPELGRRDAPCHGTFSQVAFLTELGRRRGGNHHERARELARRAVARRQTDGAYRVACGSVSEVTNHGFFLGSIGIGYQLLRLSAPDRLPSVLRFE